MEGILDIAHEGSGLLRPKNFAPSTDDIYISSSQIRRFGLRVGDLIGGQARKPKENERYWGLLKVEKVNGDDVGDFLSKQRVNFDDLMVVYPDEQLKLSTTEDILTTRMVDLVSPVGFGQRALVVSPPKAGKTWLVENGKDVVILLDSITRMARAYNLALPTSGRTLTGGFDPVALYPAKKFFGAARNIEKGGSLTIIGTCLVETGSRMDDLVYEEFKGTGNMELHLTRKLAEKRIFPAIDVSKSGTRQDELLFGREKLTKVNTLRRMIDMINDDERTETLLDRLVKTKDNDSFLDSLKTV